MAIEVGRGSSITRNSSDRAISEVAAFVLVLTAVAGSFDTGRLTSNLEIDVRALLLPVLVLVSMVSAATCRQNRLSVADISGVFVFVVWAGYMAASAFWGPGGRPSEVALEFFFLAVLVLATVGIVTRYDEYLELAIWRWFLIVGILYLADAMLRSGGGGQRFSAFGGGPNVFVRIMLLSCIAAIVLAYRSRNPKVAMLIFPFVFGAVMSGSRGGMVAGVVGGVVVILYLAWKYKNIWIIPSIVFAIALGVLLISTYGRETRFFQFINERYIVQTLESGNTSGRSELADEAIRLFWLEPIMGHGAGGFTVLQNTRLDTYAHNLFLSTAAEGGVIGLLFLGVAMCLLIARLLHSGGQSSVPAVCFGVGSLVVLVSAQFSGSYYDSRLVWILLICGIGAARLTSQETIASKGLAK